MYALNIICNRFNVCMAYEKLGTGRPIAKSEILWRTLRYRWISNRLRYRKPFAIIKGLWRISVPFVMRDIFGRDAYGAAFASTPSPTEKLLRWCMCVDIRCGFVFSNLHVQVWMYTQIEWLFQHWLCGSRAVFHAHIHAIVLKALARFAVLVIIAHAYFGRWLPKKISYVGSVHVLFSLQYVCPFSCHTSFLLGMSPLCRWICKGAFCSWR